MGRWGMAMHTQYNQLDYEHCTQHRTTSNRLNPVCTGRFWLGLDFDTTLITGNMQSIGFTHIKVIRSSSPCCEKMVIHYIHAREIALEEFTEKKIRKEILGG